MALRPLQSPQTQDQRGEVPAVLLQAERDRRVDQGEAAAAAGHRHQELRGQRPDLSQEGI